MFNETAPNAIWSARPSLRANVVSLIAAVVITLVVWNLVPFAIKAAYEATPNLPFWSYETILWAQRIIKWAMLVGIAINLWRMGVLWTERYEITPGRFLHHHGILVRKHDQIELQRIRDFRVINPLFAQSMGLGKVWMLARDETSPEITIGPFTNAREVQEIIRDAMLAHQRATGYREFESSPGG